MVPPALGDLAATPRRRVVRSARTGRVTRGASRTDPRHPRRCAPATTSGIPARAPAPRLAGGRRPRVLLPAPEGSADASRDPGALPVAGQPGA